jgi:hypothetical protein
MIWQTPFRHPGNRNSQQRNHNADPADEECVRLGYVPQTFRKHFLFGHSLAMPQTFYPIEVTVENVTQHSRRNPSMPLDAFVYAPDPDVLAVEFADHGAACNVPLKDTHDGLRGFEICDPDGYVLFFGRPRWTSGAAMRGIFAYSQPLPNPLHFFGPPEVRCHAPSKSQSHCRF